MPKIHALSDIHDDASRQHVGNWRIPATDADVIVVAGDIAGRLATQGRDWLEAQVQRLGKPIVAVAGNHDFRKVSLDREIDRFHDRQRGSDVWLLGGDIATCATVAGIRFVGNTLWTDYAISGDVDAGMRAHERGSRDIGKILSGTGRVRPLATTEDILAAHHHAIEMLEYELWRPSKIPTVVVTHHAPSARSLFHGRVEGHSDAAYASDLEWMMREYRPEMWIHGHVHHRVDYTVGDTRVLCNARGFVGPQRTPVVNAKGEVFDENLVVNVERLPRRIPDGFAVERGQLTCGGIPLGPVNRILDEMEHAAYHDRLVARYGYAHPTTGERITPEEHRAWMAAKVADEA